MKSPEASEADGGRRLPHHRLFWRGEVVAYERFAAWLNHFHIAAKRYTRWADCARPYSTAVTQRDGNIAGASVDKNFRRSGSGRPYLDRRQSFGVVR